MITLASQASVGTGRPGPEALLALLVLFAVAAVWFGWRAALRRIRVRKAAAILRGDFADYALAALVNAAKLDRKVVEAEVEAIALSMRDIAGPEFDVARVQAVLAAPGLGKDDLLAYLSAKASAFTHAQKVSLLKALLAVFVADGRFDECEHAALIEYTAAVGFDRHGAPQMLQDLVRDMARGRVT